MGKPSARVGLIIMLERGGRRGKVEQGDKEGGGGVGTTVGRERQKEKERD